MNTDTWADRLRGTLVCRVLGHRWHRKMRGAVCRRCSLFTDHPPATKES